MTTKEIALATGKPERTVYNWVKRYCAKSAEAGAKLAEAQKSGGKPAEWTLDESCQIIEIGLGKNAAALYRENANQKPTTLDAAAIAQVVGQTITAMMPAIRAALMGTVPENKITALPAPLALSTRDQLRRVVNAYGNASGDFRGAWNELYTQYYYRYHRNLRECAKNRNMDTLDYAESEGLLEDLLALAIDLYGRAA